MSGAEEKRLLCEESHVRITFSCSSLHFVTNSIIEIRGVIAQLLDWWVMLHSCVWRYVQVWGNGCTCYIPSRPTLGELQLLFLAEECLETNANLCVNECLYSAMSSDITPLTAWATGMNDIWPQLQKGFKHLSVEYATLSDRSTQSVNALERSDRSTQSVNAVRVQRDQHNW